MSARAGILLTGPICQNGIRCAGGAQGAEACTFDAPNAEVESDWLPGAALGSPDDASPCEGITSNQQHGGELQQANPEKGQDDRELPADCHRYPVHESPGGVPEAETLHGLSRIS